MKRIFVAGILAILPMGIVIFLFKWIIMDFLSGLFQPAILLMFGKEYLVLPLTIVFTLLIIIAVGSIASRFNPQQFLEKKIKREPRNVHQMPGALVELTPGSYLLAAIIKRTELKKSSGEKEEFFVLYSASAPIPWSGFPIIFAKKEQVIPLQISLGEVYRITTSFGKNAQNLEELQNFDAG